MEPFGWLNVCGDGWLNDPGDRQIPAILQFLVRALQDSDPIDLNSFAVMASGEAKHDHALIRILTEAVTSPTIAVLVDGDDGGKKRLEYLKELMKKHEIANGALAKDTTVEDYLPLPSTLYVRAVATYANKLAQDFGTSKDSLDAMLAAATESFSAKYSEQLPSGGGRSRATSANASAFPGLCDWGQEVCMQLAGLSTPPSKVGIAREYVALLDGLDIGGVAVSDLQRPKQLMESILGLLKLPRLTDVEKGVVSKSGNSP